MPVIQNLTPPHIKKVSTWWYICNSGLSNGIHLATQIFTRVLPWSVTLLYNSLSFTLKAGFPDSSVRYNSRHLQQFDKEEKNMQSENTTKYRNIASEIKENCFYGALKSDADALTQLEHGIYMII